jgi:hypothetical protein
MRKMLAVALVVILALTGTLSVASADPGKAVTSRDLLQVTIIDYAKGDKCNPHWGCEGPPQEDKDYNHYETLPGKWASLPVDFSVDISWAPVGALAEVQAAFQAWEDASGVDLFGQVVQGTRGPGQDFVNTVSWRILVGQRDVLAATYLWINDIDADGVWDAGEPIVETDVIFNDSHKWAIDPDGEGPEKLKGKYYDVRNVATHEIGHVVGLDDLYADTYSELTMYGYAAPKETKKISLEAGDIAGAQFLYGP